MQIPQAFPVRTAEVLACDPEQLSAAQPERLREYVQIGSGAFKGVLHERSSGSISMLHERWSCAMRVRCGRPNSYVAFSLVVSSPPARWCAVELWSVSLLVLEHDWELTSRGPLESISFAIERGRLELLEMQLCGMEPRRRVDDNRAFAGNSSGEVTALFQRRLRRALVSGELPPTAQRVLEDELGCLAVRLLRRGQLEPARRESPSRRRAAVRTVEDYLDAHERSVPSLADLCAVAGVSERTLEYAFCEQLGTTPVRYLRLRRLSRVRSELLRSEPGTTRVTEIAMRWGFWELGRFAREYHAFFGELPSETLGERRAMTTEPAR